jgi:hypothetical protein
MLLWNVQNIIMLTCVFCLQVGENRRTNRNGFALERI